MAFFSTPGRTSPVVRVSYAQQLFVPKPYNPGDPLKYSCTLWLDKKSKECEDFLRAMVADMNACLVGQWPAEESRPKPVLVGETFSPIKDGDVTKDKNGKLWKDKDPGLIGHYFIRVNSTRKPALLDAGRQEILDPNGIYSGCFVKVNINAFAFGGDRNSGVTMGLNAVQFIKDGGSLGGAGQINVDEAFADESVGSNDPANYQPVKGDDNPFAQPGANPLS